MVSLLGVRDTPTLPSGIPDNDRMRKVNILADGTPTHQTFTRERLAFIFRLEGHPQHLEENAKRLMEAGFTDVHIKGNAITLTAPCLIDAHMHLREGSLQQAIISTSVQHVVASIVMPNTHGRDSDLPGSIDGISTANQYAHIIGENSKGMDYKPMMTLTFNHGLTENDLWYAKDHNVKGIKWYPDGGTTNATERGNQTLDVNDQRFYWMEKHNIPFLIHCEKPLILNDSGAPVSGEPTEAEREMAAEVAALAKARPNLQIVIEHITTREAVEVVKAHPNVHCTVTPQHLVYADIDVRTGHGTNLNALCRPEVKRYADLMAIQELILHSDEATISRIMFGTDSAPHPIWAKQGWDPSGEGKDSCMCANGAFNIPSGFSVLMQWLEEAGRLELFPKLAWQNAAAFYDVEHLIGDKPVAFSNTGYEVPRMLTSQHQMAGRAIQVPILEGGKMLRWNIQRK